MIGKVVYSRRNYCKITEDSIEQEQLINGYMEDLESSTKEKPK